MAKKFDLAALMGEAVSKSNTGEMRVEQIPLAEIEENENNSYAQTGGVSLHAADLPGGELFAPSLHRHG